MTRDSWIGVTLQQSVWTLRSKSLQRVTRRLKQHFHYGCALRCVWLRKADSVSTRILWSAFKRNATQRAAVVQISLNSCSGHPLAPRIRATTTDSKNKISAKDSELVSGKFLDRWWKWSITFWWDGSPELTLMVSEDGLPGRRELPIHSFNSDSTESRTHNPVIVCPTPYRYVTKPPRHFIVLTWRIVLQSD